MGTPTRPALITMDFVPRSDLVTYKFYVGRLHVLEDKVKRPSPCLCWPFTRQQYAEALECLEYALAQCHPRARANRRKILTYLIPIKLCKGSLPSARLIQVTVFHACVSARSHAVHSSGIQFCRISGLSHSYSRGRLAYFQCLFREVSGALHQAGHVPGSREGE